MKQVFDVVAAFVVLFLALPLWALVAFLIKVDSPGPVFYKGKRVGKDGRLFFIYKFRTMTADAPQRGPGITRDGDPRVTRIGRFLRKLKIDEMPQLINVLRGEMSIIGPRPEDPRYVRLFPKEYQEILRVRPGMASPAFIRYRHEEEVLASAEEDPEDFYIRQVLPEKLKLDLEYVRRQSFAYDLVVFLRAWVSLFQRS